ncbi:hypothetical protein MXM31_11830 [Klebsiella aerogenes]|uniref:hypothetical protein n=1 Tax=Klebsiella aerogenes TaxID=548 RepID=UPI002DB9065C|nr:hypothetical protein [Klebsiella aerogenes]MEB5696855.1 hypothetical protein [Klebsiella aerogenes]
MTRVIIARICGLRGLSFALTNVSIVRSSLTSDDSHQHVRSVPETDVHADIAAVKATKFAKQDLLKAT